ncbi:hypothetical protein HS7_07260 [Sulfolobales archaeon HS-7]|nr:hypothetical protein HS7_07260 [Sulfolobales archaeon HS-7]
MGLLIGEETYHIDPCLGISAKLTLSMSFIRVDESFFPYFRLTTKGLSIFFGSSAFFEPPLKIKEN